LNIVFTTAFDIFSGAIDEEETTYVWGETTVFYMLQYKPETGEKVIEMAIVFHRIYSFITENNKLFAGNYLNRTPTQIQSLTFPFSKIFYHFNSFLVIGDSHYTFPLLP
jgi:hypothetical protein